MYVFDSGKTILKLLQEQGMMAIEEPKNRPLLLRFNKIEKHKSGKFKANLKDGRNITFENGEMLLRSIMESAQAMEFVLFA